MLDRYDYELEDVMIPNEENELIKLKKEIEKLKKEKQETLNFIGQRCIFDSHLQGFCMGLSAGEVKTLVLKIGGLDEYKKRDVERH